MSDSNMRYCVRSVKYLIRLLVLLAAVFALMQWSGTSRFSSEGFMQEFFCSMRGAVFTAAVLVWCALYPRVEYVRRKVPAVHTGSEAADIIRACESAGMRIESRTDTCMVFRSDSTLRRVLLLWEDDVRITDCGDGIEIAGNRRAVAEA